jgi:hypothetical protein
MISLVTFIFLFSLFDFYKISEIIFIPLTEMEFEDCKISQGPRS